MREEAGRIDRYGKKYGWIAFHEAAGRLEDEGRLPQRHWGEGHGPDADIDPSFPEPAAAARIQLGDWLSGFPASDAEWLRKDAHTVPDGLLVVPNLRNSPGPWVLVWGQLSQGSDIPGRHVFALTPSACVSVADLPGEAQKLREASHPGRWEMPRPSPHYYLYAGEIPWSPHYDEPSDEPPLGDAIGDGVSAQYLWEDHHSTLNRAGGATVPGRAFAQMFELHGAPQTFDLFEPDGRRASVSCRPDDPWEGNLLYIRGDLLRRFLEAKSAELLWLAWGERQVVSDSFSPEQRPEIISIYKRDGNLHRRVVVLDRSSMTPLEHAPSARAAGDEKAGKKSRESTEER
jgi:hypothetical protein